MKKAILTLSMLLIVTIVISQTPQAFKYQAIARNSSGNLIQNQLVAFRISILQGGPSGTLVYQESHAVTTTDFGLANLQIGQGTLLFGTFSGINWAAGQVFMKVELDPAGGIAYLDMGTTELLSVPYALYAGSSGGWHLTGNAGTNPATDFVGTTDNTSLAFRVNNTLSGKIDPVLLNTTYGYQAGESNVSGYENLFSGYQSGIANTTGYYNTFLGAFSGVSNDGGFGNAFAGYYSGASNLNGFGNSFFGHYAGSMNTGGNYNSYFGENSGSSNAGSNNAFFGAEAGLLLTSGSNNILIGYKAGKNLTTASNNIILGYDIDAPVANGSNQMVIGASDLLYGDLVNKRIGIGTTSPSYKFEVAGSDAKINGVRIGRGAGNSTTNTAVGMESLNANTSGTNNTACGEKTLNSNTTGFSNTAFGKTALFKNAEGTANTSIGHSALYNNTVGSINIAVGYMSLYSNTTGSANTAVGVSALYSNQANSRNTAVGHQAMYYADSQTTGIETKNTAIGYEALKGSSITTNNTGTQNTAVGDRALASNSLGERNTAVGITALGSNLEGDWNTAIGAYALVTCLEGSYNTVVGTGADVHSYDTDYATALGRDASAATNSVAVGAGASTSIYTNSIALGYNANATASNQVRLGNTSMTSLYCSGANQIISGTTYDLYVSSTGRIGKLTASDKIISSKKTIEINTSQIYDLTPVSYTLKDGSDQFIGLIADDVAIVLPELVSYSKESSVVEGSESEALIPDVVNYDKLTVLMLEEMKKLKKQNEDLQRQIDELNTYLKR